MKRLRPLRSPVVLATLRSDSLGLFQNQVASLDSSYRLRLEYRPLTVGPIPIERYAEIIEGLAGLIGLNSRLISEWATCNKFNPVHSQNAQLIRDLGSRYPGSRWMMKTAVAAMRILT